MKSKVQMTLVSTPIVAHTKKLSQKWTCDLSQEFKGQPLKNLKVGKKIILDCLGPSEFVVDFIDKRGYAYLRSNKVCNIAKPVGKNKWEADWSFYGLSAARQLKIWHN